MATITIDIFNNNKNASFFFISIETPYRIIEFLPETPATPIEIRAIGKLTRQQNIKIINYQTKEYAYKNQRDFETQKPLKLQSYSQ